MRELAAHQASQFYKEREQLKEQFSKLVAEKEKRVETLERNSEVQRERIKKLEEQICELEEKLKAQRKRSSRPPSMKKINLFPSGSFVDSNNKSGRRYQTCPDEDDGTQIQEFNPAPRPPKVGLGFRKNLTLTLAEEMVDTARRPEGASKNNLSEQETEK